jgi:ADP-dependent NAD(P)H-hydrate dehydratase / NAD(P)H-hydrate epimerase
MSRSILTAAEMRAAEASAIAAGTPAAQLMERAGAAAAEAIWRFAGPVPALILCGPGNNGGDGYVIARRLAERGAKIRVAASAEPKTPDAGAARAAWQGPVETLADAPPAPLLVDALFGTGLARPLDESLSRRLAALAAEARVRVAVDLPSGVATDSGAILSPVPDFDLTITFATLKPSHLLQPAARHMGRLVVADIGVEAESLLHEIDRPALRRPSADDHKYSRGYVAIVSGRMAGASALAAEAALRGGAGYVRLNADNFLGGTARAVVQSGDLGALQDRRTGAVVAGPGLGQGDLEAGILNLVITTAIPAVVDADALTLIADNGLDWLHRAPRIPILTPHAGEFARLFPDLPGSKVEQARAAASLARSVVVYKGPDTVVAAPGGRAAIARPASAWLASAGTGDVLAGVIAAARASGLDAFEAACAGVWLHGRAAELAGPGLIADDLLDHLASALAECL